MFEFTAPKRAVTLNWEVSNDRLINAFGCAEMAA